MLKVNPELPEADAVILPLPAPGVEGLVVVPVTEIITPAHGLGGGLVPPPPPLLQAYKTEIKATIKILMGSNDTAFFTC